MKVKLDPDVEKNIVRPATREVNYFFKYGKFKNINTLPNKRAKGFAIKLIKEQCKLRAITEYDELIKRKEEELNV